MQLQIVFGMKVEATKPSEQEGVDKLNAEIEALQLRFEDESGTHCEMDECLAKDFTAIMRSLTQLMQRARASR